MGWLELRAAQHFELSHAGSVQQATQFVQSPLLALSQARFLRQLEQQQNQLSGELVVLVPVLGEVDLPFASTLHLLATGAQLQPLPLSKERAWVEVQGNAVVGEGRIEFGFEFVAHLQAPDAAGWGSAAFEKMVRAAAERTLTRVAAALPASIEGALHDFLMK